MIIKSIEDVRSATTKDLLKFWNDRNVDQPLKRFANRKSGEAKVIAVIELQKQQHSKAVSETWKDPDVAEARSVKEGVLVAWKGLSNDYKSTRQAFVALGLPFNKHIKFRRLLKVNGKAVFTHEGVDYRFFIDGFHESLTTH